MCMGNYLIRQVDIKNLLIFQSPTVYSKIEKYVENAKQKGVYIGELGINE